MKNMMKFSAANLYNPHEQNPQQLIERFVVRQDIFHELSQSITSCDPQRSGPHYLIEGQRGMGKTTLLLRLHYAFENDANLRSRMIPLVFKEEAYYGIRRLFRLWENIAHELESKDRAFAGLCEQMTSAYENEFDYEDFCYRQLIDALQQNAKQIVLFIDNFGEFIRNFSFEERQRFYRILQKTPQLRIVAASAVALEAFAEQGDGCHELFERHQLAALSKEETYTLLRELAQGYGKYDVLQRIIKEQPGRVESLRLLTGGVIRTIVLLFEIFTEQEESHTLADLNAVLDRVTPLYKSRMDGLTPVQREIIHLIALQWEALSSEELVEKIRLPRPQVVAALKELEQVFLIESPNHASEPLYLLRERFFNIWYLMRLASGGNQSKITWILHFLEAWYSKSELRDHARMHSQAISHGEYEAQTAYYLSEAFARSGQLDQKTEHKMLMATKKLLQTADAHLAEELSSSDKDLFKRGEVCYHKKKYHQAIKLFSQIKNQSESIVFRLGYAYEQLEKPKKALPYYIEAAEQGHVGASVRLGLLYQHQFDDNENAERCYLSAAEKGHTDAMLHLGHFYLYALNQPEKAEYYYLTALKEGQVRAKVLGSGIFSLNGLKTYLMSAIKGRDSSPEHDQFQDFPEAKEDYLHALQQTVAEAAFQLGNIFAKDGARHEETESYYRMAFDAGHVKAMLTLGDWYQHTLNRHEQAEKCYQTAAQHGDIPAMINLSSLYQDVLKDDAKAERYYAMAADQGDVGAMNNLAWLYFEKGREKRKALEYMRQVIKHEKNMYVAHTAACIYLWNNLADEAFALAEEFMLDESAYKTLEQDILFYLILLLAKKHERQVLAYFETPQLELKNRFAPLFYALLSLNDDPNFQKMPPELTEPVNDILQRVQTLANDYA